jgi:hypothetical protein
MRPAVSGWHRLFAAFVMWRAVSAPHVLAAAAPAQKPAQVALRTGDVPKPLHFAHRAVSRPDNVARVPVAQALHLLRTYEARWEWAATGPFLEVTNNIAQFDGPKDAAAGLRFLIAQQRHKYAHVIGYREAEVYGRVSYLAFTPCSCGGVHAVTGSLWMRKGTFVSVIHIRELASRENDVALSRTLFLFETIVLKRIR